jgi:hypothetical protein
LYKSARGAETTWGGWKKENTANHQAPVDFFEELSLEYIELGHRDAAHLGVEAVRAEGVA